MIGACKKKRVLTCVSVSLVDVKRLNVRAFLLLALDEAESVGEMSGESSHCRRLIKVCPSGMSKLSLSTTASASGSAGLRHETKTQ